MLRSILSYLDESHCGLMSHGIHWIAFIILGYGLGTQNWWIVIFSPFVMESGHLYNYLTGRYRHRVAQAIPFQIMSWFVFVGITYVLMRPFD